MMECSLPGSGVDEVDVEGAWVDLPHVQGCILLQALLQLSLTVSLFLQTFKQERISVSNHGPAMVVPVNVGVGRDCTFREIRLRA
jgi:hypothetical protein